VYKIKTELGIIAPRKELALNTDSDVSSKLTDSTEHTSYAALPHYGCTNYDVSQIAGGGNIAGADTNDDGKVNTSCIDSPQNGDDIKTDLLLFEQLPIDSLQTNETCNSNPVISSNSLNSGSNILDAPAMHVWVATMQPVLTVPLSANDVELSAVVDSGAQITIFSHTYKHLVAEPDQVGYMWLHGVTKDALLAEIYWVNFKLGSKSYRMKACLAAIAHDVLLGLDFLRNNNCEISLRDNCLRIDQQEIVASSLEQRLPNFNLNAESDPLISSVNVPVVRVLTVSDVVCAPRTSTIIKIRPEKPLQSNCIIEPVIYDQLLIPRVLIDGNRMEISVACINTSGKTVVVPARSVLGTATNVEVYIACSGGYKVVDDSSKQAAAVTSEPLVEPTEINIVAGDSSAQNQVNHIPTLPELPDHLTDLLARSSAHLNPRETYDLAHLLLRYQHTFSKGDTDLGNFSLIKHRIDTGDAPPVRQRMRRTPLGFEKEEKQHLNKLLESGVIQPSQSEWASPPVLVRKKDGSVRWCIDYRRLNNVTIKDSFPLPNINECIDMLSGTVFLSVLDCASGYYQLEIDERDRHKTAFITKYGLFEHRKLGFGLCNAPASFQRAMYLVLAGLTWESVLAYIDDLVIIGRDFWDHYKNLQNVLERFEKYDLKFKPKKCALYQTETKFLGHIVSQKGVGVDPANIQAVQIWPTPTSVKEVESFLGFVNYHRDHIQNYAELAAPLYQLTGCKAKFKWDGDKQIAFDQLKLALINAPVLAFPQPNNHFILDTDASAFAVAGELSQVQDGVPRVIAYGSYALSKQQRAYCTTRLELLAILRFTREWRHYLLGRHFTIRTDHNSLKWLANFKNAQGQLARWLEELSQYDYSIEHRPGKEHSNADGLSRRPDLKDYCIDFDVNITPDLLPCAANDCKYCPTMFKQWADFASDVDYVTALNVQVGNQPDSWMTYSTSDSIAAEQDMDLDLKQLKAWLVTEPAEDELVLASQIVKHFKTGF